MMSPGRRSRSDSRRKYGGGRFLSSRNVKNLKRLLTTPALFLFLVCGSIYAFNYSVDGSGSNQQQVLIAEEAPSSSSSSSHPDEPLQESSESAVPMENQEDSILSHTQDDVHVSNSRREDGITLLQDEPRSDALTEEKLESLFEPPLVQSVDESESEREDERKGDVDLSDTSRTESNVVVAESNEVDPDVVSLEPVAPMSPKRETERESESGLNPGSVTQDGSTSDVHSESVVVSEADRINNQGEVSESSAEESSETSSDESGLNPGSTVQGKTGEIQSESASESNSAAQGEKSSEASSESDLKQESNTEEETSNTPSENASESNSADQGEESSETSSESDLKPEGTTEEETKDKPSEPQRADQGESTETFSESESTVTDDETSETPLESSSELQGETRSEGSGDEKTGEAPLESASEENSRVNQGGNQGEPRETSPKTGSEGTAEDQTSETRLESFSEEQNGGANQGGDQGQSRETSPETGSEGTTTDEETGETLSDDTETPKDESSQTTASESDQGESSETLVGQEGSTGDMDIKKSSWGVVESEAESDVDDANANATPLVTASGSEPESVSAENDDEPSSPEEEEEKKVSSSESEESSNDQGDVGPSESSSLEGSDESSSEQKPPYLPVEQLEVFTLREPNSTVEDENNLLRGVIVYLVTSIPEDLQALHHSLNMLDNRFLKTYPYPVAIFHEDLTREAMQRIQSSVSSVVVRFVKLKFRLPEKLLPLVDIPPQTVRHVIPNPEHPTGFHEHVHGLVPWAKRSNAYPYGYQHMCRFFSGAAYTLPFFRDYVWYMRLDSDTVCYDVGMDIFKYMEEHQLDYGYKIEMADGGDVVENLWNSAVSYVKSRNIEPRFMYSSEGLLHKPWGEEHLFDTVPMFYTNFEVVRLSVVKGDAYQDFFNYMDDLGGIYLHRWGDAPIRWLGLSILVDRSRTRELPVNCSHP